MWPRPLLGLVPGLRAAAPVPSKHAKLLVVLDRLAQEFEPGRTYPESEVNEVLNRFHSRPRGTAPLPGRERTRFAFTREDGWPGAVAGPSRSDGHGDQRRGLVRRGAGSDVRHEGVRFVEVDLTEVRTAGATFESCVFDRCRFNASVHEATAFVGCTFGGSNFFDATLDGCKLTGSTFTRCTLKPITVHGGQWRGVVLRGADLTGQDLSGVDLRDADLSMAVLVGANLRGANLGGVELREADLTDADLRGADLGGSDLGCRQAQGCEGRPGRRRTAGRADRRGRRT